jgi:DNA polymerase-1
MRNFSYTDTLPVDFNDELCAIDLETEGLNPRQDSIEGMSFCTKSGTAYYTTNRELMKEVLQRAKVHLFHNSVFDISFLKTHGLYTERPIEDTMLLANVYDPNMVLHLKGKWKTQKKKPFFEKGLTETFLGDGKTEYALAMAKWLKENNLGREAIIQAPKDILIGYACEDAANTFDVFHVLKEKFVTLDAWVRERFPTNQVPTEHYYEEQIALVPVIIAMQLRGVKLDINKTVLRHQEIKNEIKRLREEVDLATKGLTDAAMVLHYDRKVAARITKNKTGKIKVQPPRTVFKWSSNDHLKILFFEILKEKPTKITKKGNTSMDEAALLAYKDKYPWIQTFLDLKSFQNNLSKYFENKKQEKGEKPTNLLAVQEGGRIHPSYHLTGTTSGRFSSSSPNFQNIPKHGHIKELFIPDTGNVIIHSDYNQLEYRLVAHLSQDPLLIAEYAAGRDMHTATAQILDLSRDKAKTINFSIIYGAGGWRVADILGYMIGIPQCETRERGCKCKNCKAKYEAAQKGDEVAEKLFGQYRGLKKYLDAERARMLRYGIAITPFGRLTRLPDLKLERGGLFNHALKSGFNHTPQGMGAAITKRAMLDLHKRGYQLLNTVHDALDIEVPESQTEQALGEIQGVMENTVKLRVALKVEQKILMNLEERNGN